MLLTHFKTDGLFLDFSMADWIYPVLQGRQMLKVRILISGDAQSNFTFVLSTSDFLSFLHILLLLFAVLTGRHSVTL